MQRGRSKKKLTLENIIFVIVYIAIICVFINRVIRGIDTTDESFYASLAYRICNGNLILRDMWEQCSTSAIFPALILRIYILISGGIEGIILFFRLAYFVINLCLMSIVFCALKQYVENKYAFLISSVFLLYTPFHFYNFSYNNQADLLLLIMSCLLLIAAEKIDYRIYFISGVVCSYLAFIYPTLIIICPVLVLLILITRKITRKGWIYFTFGGLSCAFVIIVILLLTIGYRGILSGVEGILSDPAYSQTSVSLLNKFEKALNHMFAIFSEDEKVIIKIYALVLFTVGYFQKRFPKLKFIIALYPIVIYMQMNPSEKYGTYASGTNAFFLSLIAPFLLFFIDSHKKEFKSLIYFVWIPSVLLYIVIAVSSYGGAGQATQGLITGAMVSLMGIVFVISETVGSLAIKNKLFKLGSIRLCRIITSLFLVVMLLLEIRIYYSVVYRDATVNELTSKVECGPYKGLYTTEGRKKYVEQMTQILAKLQNKDESALVLYHSNFAYLMLDSTSATPTTWGIYPSIDNEDVFFKYFSQELDHIPDTVYIVDVPDKYNFDAQSEASYGFCENLRRFLADNYSLLNEIRIDETGMVKKYVLSADKNELRNNISKYRVEYSYIEGFYGLEANEYTTWSWCNKNGSLNIANKSDDVMDVKISFTAHIPSVDNKTLEIATVSNKYSYQVNTDGLYIELFESIQPGDNIITFTTDAGKYIVEADPRDLYFTINDFEINIQ